MLKKLEKGVRHTIQAAKVRLNLDEDREKARAALELAEKSDQEVVRLVFENNKKVLEIEQQLNGVNQGKYDSPSAQQKLTQAQIRLDLAKQSLKNLEEAKNSIQKEVQSVRVARGKVSPSNDEFETTKAKEIENQAKAASQEAQNGVIRIQQTLANVKLNVISPIQIASGACLQFIKEIGEEEIKYQQEKNTLLAEEFVRVTNELETTQNKKIELEETLESIQSGLLDNEQPVLNQFEGVNSSNENTDESFNKEESNNNNVFFNQKSGFDNKKT